MRASPIRRAHALGLSILSTALFCLAGLTATAGAATQSEIDAAVSDAVVYVSGQQSAASGAIQGFGGDWATTALAAAGVHAADLRTDPGAPSLQDFTLGEYTQPSWSDDPPSRPAPDYARAVMVARAAGLDPARLAADSNQPAQLAARWNPVNGGFGGGSPNDAAFAIMAMREAGLPVWALAPTVSLLRRNQHDDGGWTFASALDPVSQATPSEPDMTGAAVAALCGAGVPAYDPDVSAALTYLQGLVISGTGGIEYQWGPNSDVNGWVLSGLKACGIDPQGAGWTVGGANPVDFLLSLQLSGGEEAGGFGYLDTSEASMYSTQDALRPLAGGVFAVAPPARLDPADPVVRPAPEVPAGTPVPHLLAIELAPGNVRICKVTAPAGAALSAVLAAARDESRPAGCVGSVAVSSSGQVEAINGVTPEGSDQAWLARLDRGAAAPAGAQSVGFGDLIALRVGRNPGSDRGPVGPAGAPGPVGAPGPAGRPGKRGRRGRPGRNARLICVKRRGRVAKRAKVRCKVKRSKRRHRR